MPTSHIGTRVKQFRLIRGWTQTEAAEQLEVSRSTIARIEQGKTPSDLVQAKIERKLAANA